MSERNDDCIKLYKDVLKDPIINRNPICFTLWLHCVLMASQEGYEWKGSVIQAGSLVTTLERLERELGVKKELIKGNLKRLEKGGAISVERIPPFIIISLPDYERHLYDPVTDDISYSCIKCGDYIHKSFPHYFLEEENVLCHDCSFIESLITPDCYIDGLGSFPMAMKAVVYEGEIFVASKKKPFPFEVDGQDLRNTPEYRIWRSSVFERDEFTCQNCSKVGGQLNAHHKKSFKRHPKLRTVLSNGITLCEPCHKKVHKGEIKL